MTRSPLDTLVRQSCRALLQQPRHVQPECLGGLDASRCRNHRCAAQIRELCPLSLLVRSVNLQTRGTRFLLEPCNHGSVAAQQTLYGGGRLVAATQPNHLGWRPRQCRHLGEVRIERDKRKAVRFGMIPHGAVGSIGQSDERTCVVPGKRSVSARQSLKLRFWSNSSFISPR